MYDLAGLLHALAMIALTASAILAALYVGVPLAYRRRHRARYRRHAVPNKR